MHNIQGLSLLYIYIFFTWWFPVVKTTFSLLSVLIRGTVWWCYLAKRQNERQTFISCLTLPAMVCPTARTVIKAPPDSAQLSQNYLSCILVSHKRKTESLEPDLPFAGRGTEIKTEGRVLCSLPDGSCAGSLYWIGINRTGPRWATYDWQVSGCVYSFVSQAAPCQLNN